MKRIAHSPIVYLIRNPGRTVPMAVILVLSVMLIGGIVAIMNSIPLSVKKVYGYSRFITGVTPRGDMSYFPKIIATLKRSPERIERQIICRTMVFNVNTIVGPWPFVLHGFTASDAQYVVKKMNLGQLLGRMPVDGRGEAVVSKPLAENLHLKLGSVLLDPNDEKNYSQTVVKIVGILNADEWFAFTSYDYLALNHFPPVDVAIVFTKDLQSQRKLDAWCEKTFKGTKANVFTYAQVEKESEASLHVLFQILNFVIALLVIVVTLMMCMLVSIHLSQRIIEFGLLQALGYSRSALISKALQEACWVITAGWLLGITITLLMLFIVKSLLMDPNGFYLNPYDTIALAYTLPLPVIVAIATAFTVLHRFRQFDPITVIERRIG